MANRSIQLELPEVLLERAHVDAADEVRELITFLLESYAQDLEKARREQAYAAYYAERSPEEVADEQDILDDFAYSDADPVVNSEL